MLTAHKLPQITFQEEPVNNICVAILRSLNAKIPQMKDYKNDVEIKVHVTRFLSLDIDELGAIKYNITPLNTDAKVVFKPYLDAGIENEDTNWEEKFWETLEIKNEEKSML